MTISSTEEKEYCKVLFNYVAEPEKVTAKRKEVLDKLYNDSKKIAIPGWKKGRASLEVIKQKFKKQIEDSTRKELQSMAYDDIVFETKIKPIFYPEITKSSLNGSSYECQMLFLKKPDFELKEYKGFDIPKPHLEMTKEQLVEKYMQNLRVQHGTVQAYTEEDFVQIGDSVTFDVKCTVNGSVIDQFTEEGALYKVGSDFFKEFDDNILGMKVGEERTFDVKWDETEKANFIVKIYMGSKSIPAPLDDELAKKLNCKDINDLTSKLVGLVENQIQKQENEYYKQQIVARLLASHDFMVPPWLQLMESQSIAEKNNLKWKELTEDMKTNISQLAEKQVRLTMIVDSIREKEPNIQLSESELRNIVGQKAAEAGQDPNRFLAELQRSGKLFGVVASLQHEIAMQWLIKQSNCGVE